MAIFLGEPGRFCPKNCSLAAEKLNYHMGMTELSNWEYTMLKDFYFWRDCQLWRMLVCSVGKPAVSMVWYHVYFLLFC